MRSHFQVQISLKPLPDPHLNKNILAHGSLLLSHSKSLSRDSGPSSIPAAWVRKSAVGSLASPGSAVSGRSAPPSRRAAACFLCRTLTLPVPPHPPPSHALAAQRHPGPGAPPSPSRAYLPWGRCGHYCLLALWERAGGAEAKPAT